MRTLLTLAAAAVVGLAAPAAFAAPTITSVSLNGPSGTVWNTAKDSYYTLFVSRPAYNMFNPEDNFAGAPVTDPVAGEFDYSLAGDGFPTSVRSSQPSDPFYTLTVTLSEGAKTGTLTGVFDETTGLFTSTSSPLLLASGHYSLTDFAWNRGLSNTVGAFSASNTAPIGRGSRADYAGAFSLSTSAVPEPATWALMILGFGFIGGALRARRGRKLATAVA